MTQFFNFAATVLTVACATAIALAGDKWQFWALYCVAATCGLVHFISVADPFQSVLWSYFLAMDIINVYRARRKPVHRCPRCRSIMRAARTVHYCPSCGMQHLVDKAVEMVEGKQDEPRHD